MPRVMEVDGLVTLVGPAGKILVRGERERLILEFDGVASLLAGGRLFWPKRSWLRRGLTSMLNRQGMALRILVAGRRVAELGPGVRSNLLGRLLLGRSAYLALSSVRLLGGALFRGGG
ncbi:hypothetical protein Pan216_43270 [Planctomycetes bacterium Pan216]|uniref:Uncharacterized protein n=1 Tax=Kolteria novifilia TaxID=2527975 RepID=A0A518B928_9BACT|nr:hypothetical protein Pan216_43270 [Planctomycetes bacterium Pan216]